MTFFLDEWINMFSNNEPTSYRILGHLCEVNVDEFIVNAKKITLLEEKKNKEMNEKQSWNSNVKELEESILKIMEEMKNLMKELKNIPWDMRLVFFCCVLLSLLVLLIWANLSSMIILIQGMISHLLVVIYLSKANPKRIRMKDMMRSFIVNLFLMSLYRN